MANFLAALLQGLSGGGGGGFVNAAGQPVDPLATTEVEGIDVVMPRKPKPPPAPPARNPFTDDYIAAAQAASQAQGQLPRVSGGTDAGLYGFLPQKMQNGRLRDILGAVGDGLLLGGGNKPIYQPRKDARLMGQALLGYDQDPQAAIARLAQTGAPDSIDTAKDLLGTIQTSADKAAQRELTQAYQKELTRSRTDGMLQRAAVIVPGVLSRANTPESYLAAYERLDTVAKRIDPEANPTTAWGLPDPLDWTPESTAWIGTTGGQQINADIGRERIAQSNTNNIRSTSTSAANNIRSTSTSAANNRRSVAQSDVNSRRSAEKSGKSGGGSGLNPRTTAPKGGAKPAAKGPVVTNGDVAYLRANPGSRAAFEKHFGKGSAARYLGK